MSKFIICDETGKDREATLIANFSYESDNYTIYSINRDNDNVNIFVSKLINNNNVPLLVDIYDKNKKETIDKVVKFFINGLSKKELKKYRVDIIDNIDFFDINDLVFTSYKTYSFNIKKELFNKIIKIYNETININNNNDNVLSIETPDLNFIKNIPQKINEEDNTLFELNNGEKKELENSIKKITLEKLDINDEESLKNMFDEKNVEVANNSRGYISDLALILIGISAFTLTLIFLILQINY